jgi:hypothetical protein
METGFLSKERHSAFILKVFVIVFLEHALPLLKM